MRKLLIGIAILLVTNFASAELKPPAPGGFTTGAHQVKNRDHPKSAPDELKQTPPPNIKTVEARNPETQITEHTIIDKTPSEWWLIGLTAVLALATYRLVVQTRRLVDETALASKRQAAETQAALEISRSAANAATEQSKTATEALQRSNRAWVGLMGNVEMITPLSFDKDGVHCKIRLTINNVGPSPALNTFSFCKLIIGPYPYPDPHTYIAVANDDFLKKTTNDMGITLIPGDPMQWPIIEVREPMLEKRSNVSVWLHGYFGYKDEFGTIHTSSFLFSFITSDGVREIAPRSVVEGRFERFGVGWSNT